MLVSIAFFTAFFSAFLDNIPFTATMVPLIKELQGAMNIYPLWWRLSLDACFNGNTTIIGAAANVIVIESANSKGFNISFWKFFRYGTIITLFSLVISTIYLYIRFFIN